MTTEELLRLCRDECKEAMSENKRLRREIKTLRNFIGGIKANVDLALRDYGQPTGDEEGT